MMTYNEKLIGTAWSVGELLTILGSVPNSSASIELEYSGYTSGVEVWYDEEVNAVILK